MTVKVKVPVPVIVPVIVPVKVKVSVKVKQCAWPTARLRVIPIYIFTHKRSDVLIVFKFLWICFLLLQKPVSSTQKNTNF